METQTSYQYRAGIGCYGSTRGTTLAAIANERVKQLTNQTMKIGDLEIIIEGFGSQKEIFMSDKKIDHPVKEEITDALLYWQKNADEIGLANINFEGIKKTLKETGRKKVTKNQLQRADIVLGIDTFMTQEYAAYGEVSKNDERKYQTVLQGANLVHTRYGKDLDDTEASIDFVERVVVQKIKGKEPIGNIDPKNAKFYDLAGNEYVASSNQAMRISVKDLIYLGTKIGEKIFEEACKKNKRD